MPTIASKILAYLREHPEGADDDQISDALDIKPRQSVNQTCRRLEKAGLLRRDKSGNKITNTVLDVSNPLVSNKESQPTDSSWHTEANTQKLVIDWLESKGWKILSSANTATKERGPDISAEKSGTKLLVTVKGFPQGTERTRPNVQARHWFIQGFHDLLIWRGEDKEVNLLYALPDFPRYRTMAERVIWLKPTIAFAFLWVKEDGSVVEQ